MRLNKGVVLKPWECADKENFLKGHPKHLIKKKAALDDLLFAIQEAEDYLSTSEDIRLPPHMVPSDLDPTLDPPPPMEREELMEEDDDDAAASDHDEEEQQEDEDLSGGSDQETSKSKKKPAKEKKASSKEKKVSSKEKKPAKEKKASKTKKEKEPKEKKKSVKKDKEQSASSQEDKKRKKPATTDEASSSATATSGDASEAAAPSASPKASPGKASPSKVARKEKAADVKSGDVKPKSGKSKSSGSELTGEALSTVLEKEIKWILANCQFDEMTTKTVRKLLEKRLNMDLRHHKVSIKDGVARVIASMEDGTDAPADDVVSVKSEPAPPAPLSEPVPAENMEVAAAPASPVAEAEDVKMEKPEEPEAVAESEEPEANKDDDAARITQRLMDAERELGLALNEEPKLVKSLTALQQQLPTVDKELFAKSPLVAKLVELRAHEEDSVAKLVAAIATQWDVEELVPAPKPIREEDILEMKEKLESAETSHDDMLACLGQLAKVRLACDGC